MRSPTFSGTYGMQARAESFGAVVSAWGELDVAAVPELRRRLETVRAEGVTRLLLDLEGVTFIDSVSLAAIVAAKRRMGDDAKVVVATRHPYVLLILEAGGLESVIEVRESFEQAEAALIE